MWFRKKDWDIDKEIQSWKNLCDPLDKILAEYKYFCEHGKFPDPLPKTVRDDFGQKIKDTSILFTEKCPKPLSCAERRVVSGRSHYDGMTETVIHTIQNPDNFDTTFIYENGLLTTVTREEILDGFNRGN